MVLDTQHADRALRPSVAVPASWHGRLGSREAPNPRPAARRPASVVARAASKAATGCALLLAVPLVLLARLLRPLVLIRFGRVVSQRIGYFAFDPEVYLSARDARLQGCRVADLLYFTLPVCNRQLALMWRRVLPITGFARALERANRWFPGAARHQAVLCQPAGRDLQGILQRTAPHLVFTAQERAQGWTALRALGIEPGAPFVCFHARDQAYLEWSYQDRDWAYHTYRNVEIRDLLPALEELTRRGYLGVRMGAVVEEALPAAHPRIIDYSMTGRTELLDIFLAAHCRFFLSDPSGIIALPMVFRRPVAVVNLMPFEYIHSWGPQDLSIPKKLWLRAERRWLTFREILASGIGRHFQRTEQFDQAGIDVVDNTPEEITAVALEMDARLAGTWQPAPEDEERQRRFWALFAGSPLHGVIRARIGAEFLRQHAHLLEP